MRARPKAASTPGCLEVKPLRFRSCCGPPDYERWMMRSTTTTRGAGFGSLELPPAAGGDSGHPALRAERPRARAGSGKPRCHRQQPEGSHEIEDDVSSAAIDVLKGSCRREPCSRVRGSSHAFHKAHRGQGAVQVTKEAAAATDTAAGPGCRRHRSEVAGVALAGADAGPARPVAGRGLPPGIRIRTTACSRSRPRGLEWA